MAIALDLFLKKEYINKMNFAYCMYTAQGDYTCQTGNDNGNVVEGFYNNSTVTQNVVGSASEVTIASDVQRGCYPKQQPAFTNPQCEIQVRLATHQVCNKSKQACFVPHPKTGKLPPGITKERECNQDIIARSKDNVALLSQKYASYESYMKDSTAQPAQLVANIIKCPEAPSSKQ
jgi:hypothetical protein